MLLLALALAIPFGPDVAILVTTDQAQYKPGRTVHVLLQCDSKIEGNLAVTAYRNGEELKGVIPSRPWKPNQLIDWSPPTDDHQGYLLSARVYGKDGDVKASGSCGVDVSSNWTTFPRYGYLSHFGPELRYKTNAILDNLRNFHINALQFYDWQWKHHMPLATAFEWVDIANRPTYASTIESFVGLAHQSGIACMAYNLGYGAVDGFESDGVSKSWELFDDAEARTPYSLPMPQGWATKRIYLMDAGNLGWQGYLFSRENLALRAFHFDGWQMDQVGNPGRKYESNGKPIELRTRFPALLSAAKKEVRGVLIFNNVGTYGLVETLDSPTDAMYAEAWEGDGQKTFADLKRVVEQSRSMGKASIIAAYMDYERAKQFDGKQTQGQFNAPGVLLTDATILAAGGAHIELGDSGNLLCNEYFPNHNLVPDADLMNRLRSYYDFSVAYETLLRGHDVHPTPLNVQIKGAPCSADGSARTVWVFAQSTGDKMVIHLINLLSSTDNQWRDTRGTRMAPQSLSNLRLELPPGTWRKAFIATPDDGVGAPRAIKIQDSEVQVPHLNYWTMVVLSK